MKGGFVAWVPTGAMAVGAIALLLIGSAGSEDTIAAGGFALLGATLTHLVDRVRDEQRRQEDEDQERRRDLDETRRLLYIAVAVGLNEGQLSEEMAGTLVNALVHHSELVTPEEGLDLAVWAMTGGPMDPEVDELVNRILYRIATELGNTVRPALTNR